MSCVVMIVVIMQGIFQGVSKGISASVEYCHQETQDDQLSLCNQLIIISMYRLAVCIHMCMRMYIGIHAYYINIFITHLCQQHYSIQLTSTSIITQLVTASFRLIMKIINNLLHKQCKQVDILISKNQALQILYLKHCVYNINYHG